MTVVDEHQAIRRDAASVPVLETRDMRVWFPDARRGLPGVRGRSGVTAVDGADLDVAPGEIVGLVGESGSGKTTLALAAARLTAPTSGQVLYRGEDVTRYRGQTLRSLRRQVQMIFQDPHSSLSPRLRVRGLLEEPYVIHDVAASERQSVEELLEMVELPKWVAGSYPHELSGGQARRVGIARALALRPALIIADEPTAGLDASATSSILNLLEQLRDSSGTAYLIITHAMGVVGHLADRIAVMYLGRIVELGEAETVLDRPVHPYTKALMGAILSMDPNNRRPATAVRGEVPSPRNPPSGCHFHPRCPLADERCRTDDPVLREVGSGHTAACHYAAVG